MSKSETDGQRLRGRGQSEQSGTELRAEPGEFVLSTAKAQRIRVFA